MPKANAPNLPSSTAAARTQIPAVLAMHFEELCGFARLFKSSTGDLLGGNERVLPGHVSRTSRAAWTSSCQDARRPPAASALAWAVKWTAMFWPGCCLGRHRWEASLKFVPKMMNRFCRRFNPPTFAHGGDHRRAACRPSVEWVHQIRCIGLSETTPATEMKTDRNHVRKWEVIRFRQSGRCQHCSGGTGLKRTMCDRLWLKASGNNTHPKPCAIPPAPTKSAR